MGKNVWQKTTKKTDVHYFIRQIDTGGFFGLEELCNIGLLKVEGKNSEARQVSRQLRVTTMSNCKLLYMTSTAFFRIFQKYELEKLKEFCEEVDLADIESRVRNNWMHKKRLHKQLHEAVVDSQNRENRLAPWLNKVHSKKHNLPNILLEDNRIKVIDTRVRKFILTDPEEYNRDLKEKEKEAVLREMIAREEEAARHADDESSLGR